MKLTVKTFINLKTVINLTLSSVQLTKKRLQPWFVAIAQAALELNHVFEAAQAAADDYLASVRSVDRDALQAQAKAEADQILAQARAEAEQLKAQTKRECDVLTEAAEHKRAQTEADCAALRAKTEQEIAARRAAFEQSTRELLRSRCDTDILPEEGKVK